MSAYYNEIDPKAAAWLRELIKVGAIAPGEVDERDVRDVRPSELDGFAQCHFFAGIGVWSHALRLAGWSDEQPVWTGACPCQPFSAAGRGLGFADPRHLWPSWFHLIRERNPPNIFGEQVASPDGLRWLDLVQTHLEAEGYAIGSADICAAGVGAPHIRQRLYFVAEPGGERRDRLGLRLQPRRSLQAGPQVGGRGQASELVDARGARGGRNPGTVPGPQEEGSSEGFGTRRISDKSFAPGATRGFWDDVEWLHCRDEKYRPVEPGTFPLVDGAPHRVGRLRGYGNGLVAQQAAAFIEAYTHC